MEIKEALAQIKAGIKAAQFDEIEAKAWDMMAAHPDSVELLMALGEAAMQAVNFSRADYYFMKAKLKGVQRLPDLAHMQKQYQWLSSDHSSAPGLSLMKVTDRASERCT